MNRYLGNSTAPLLGSALLFLAFSGWGNEPLAAQTNTAKAGEPGKRYLLIIETSRTMEKRSQGTLQTLGSVLSSSLSNELTKADTIGTWTYNETLNTGRLPLLKWSARAKNTMQTLGGLLAKEKYQKQPHFDKVLPTLASVVANSKLLTVILVTSGTEEIHGTPFDAPINETFTKWRQQQQDKRMPFVVLFRAAQGKMTAYSVAAAPWPLEIPPLPEIPKPIVAEAKPAPPEKKAPEKPASTVPPLIISGRKPTPPPTNTPAAPVSTKVETPVAATQIVATLAEAPKTNTPAPATPGTNQAGTPSAVVPALTAVSPPVKPETAPGPTPPATAAVAAADTTSSTQPQQSSAPKPADETVSSAGQPTAVPAISPTESAETQAQLATAVQQPHTLKLGLWLIGGGCLALTIGLVWWFVSRSRPHHSVSLITRSFDRNE